MELKFLIFLFVTLPFINCGKKEPTNFKNEVKVISEYVGKKIADDKLFLDGFLGEGRTGFVYAGRLVKHNHPVAIKFFTEKYFGNAKREWRAIDRMNDYSCPVKVETIGIPKAYHCGGWVFKYRGELKSYYLIAMTKLDQSLADIQDQEKELNKKIIHPLDMLILFKNFVVQSKRMHTYDVYHRNVNSEKIMFGLGISFLIDFDSEIMENEETYELAHKDWQGFIFMITDYYKIKIEDKTKVNVEKLIQGIKLDKGLDEGLKTVIEEFAKKAFSVDNLLNYDYLKKIIDIEIGKKRAIWELSSPKFSWLSN